MRLSYVYGPFVFSLRFPYVTEGIFQSKVQFLYLPVTPHRQPPPPICRKEGQCCLSMLWEFSENGLTYVSKEQKESKGFVLLIISPRLLVRQMLKETREGSSAGHREGRWCCESECCAIWESRLEDLLSPFPKT